MQKRLPRWTFLALWGVASGRFLIPFAIPSHVSAYTAVSRALMLNEAVRRLTDSTAARTLAAEGAMNAPPTAGTQALATPFPWLRAIWLFGMAVCAGFFIFNHLRARRIYARSLPCRALFVLANVNRNGPLRKIAVRISDQVATPLTYGLFRPVILLPKRMEKAGLDFVLAHELCHVRRLDVLWKGLFALCACVHWFNPLAWLMLMLAGRDLELSCDGNVIKGEGGKTRKAYALTFQQANGLSPDGVLTEDLYTAILAAGEARSASK